MFNPKFSITDFELNKEIKRFFTDERRRRLDVTDPKWELEEILDATERVDGQLSWVAQLLGHNGDNYWPRQKLTLQEKRALLLGTYGVYERNLRPYEEWAYPFNRQPNTSTETVPIDENNQKDSGQRRFKFSEDFSQVIVAGQNLVLPYKENRLFTWVPYFFDGEIEVVQGEPYILEYNCEENTTKVLFNQSIGPVKIKSKGQTPEIFFEIIQWEDISDWRDQTENFEGLWSQKGGFFPNHHAFDATGLYGYNETYQKFTVPSIFLNLVEVCPVKSDVLVELAPRRLDYERVVSIPITLRKDRCDPNPVTLLPGESKGIYSLSEDLILTVDVDDPVGFTLEAEATYGTVWDEGEYDNQTGFLIAVVDSGEYDREGSCSLDEGEFGDEPLTEVVLPVQGLEVNEYSSACFNYDFSPDVRHSLSLLRTWNHKDLQQNDKFSFFNPLVADMNRGPRTPDLHLRYYFRLPPDMVRDGEDWSTTKLMAQNFNYVGKTPSLDKVTRNVNPLRPINYDEDFDKALPVGSVVYHEDYLTSSTSNEDCDYQEGYEKSKIEFELEMGTPFFDYAITSSYDALCSRVSVEDGDWQGDYYCGFSGKGKLKGAIPLDLASGKLNPSNPVDWDASEFKYGILSDDYTSELVDSSDYRVGYAYFSTDMSACEEAIFDPWLAACRRPEANILAEDSSYIIHQN